MAVLDRAKNILLNPRAEWQVIDAEPATVGSIYAGWVVPLALIPAIAGFIGFSIIGIRLPFAGTTFRYPIAQGIEWAVIRYIGTLVAVYITAMVVDALAPSFGGTKNMVQAVKVVAYSSTAAWLAGIFAAIPGLRILSILGLYSLYLLYLGLPVLMKSPADRALGYTVVVIVVAIIVYIVIGAIAGMFLRTSGVGMGM